MIQSQTIQTVKDMPLIDVIGKYVKLGRCGANYKGLCPFHDERTPSFYVHPSRNVYKCFGCGAGGDAIKFVMDYERKTFFEAIELIASAMGIAVERAERTLEKPKKGKSRRGQFHTIPATFLDTRTPNIAQNSLTAQIGDLVGTEVMQDLLKDYKISLQEDGFIHYPQIDKAGQYRTGKSIQYKDGHRTGYFKWIHSELKKKGIMPGSLIHRQCFTGENLINTGTIAIVEGQSTMLFMAALGKAAAKYHIRQLQYFSSFTWISTGGVDGIGWKDDEVTRVLLGKEVVLFPDAGFYDQWRCDAEIMQEHGITVEVSRLIEMKYKEGFLKYNQDLRDYFMLYSDEIRQLCKPEILQIRSKDIISIVGETHTSRDFNNLIIAGIKATNGKVFDLLFDASGELMTPGEHAEEVNKLACFFEKNFQPALFDNSPCWVECKFPINC